MLFNPPRPDLKHQIHRTTTRRRAAPSSRSALRTRCRNPRCRCKLPMPTANLHEAFCCAGCYDSFHLHRCRVCEACIEQPRYGTRLLCRKSKCRTAWKSGIGFGRFAEARVAAAPNDLQETQVNRTGLSASNPVWRQIADPPLTPSQSHCATLGGSAMDAVMRVEAQNRALLRATEQAEIEANGCFTDPEWREVISPDGVLTFVAGTADQRGGRAGLPARHGELAIPDDLSIPEFLRRNGG